MKLFDVLEQLPLDVVEKNIWRKGGVHPQRLRAFRAICRQSRALADQLVQSFTVSACCGVELPSAKVSVLPAWDAAIHQRCKYLSRLPFIDSLRIRQHHPWPGNGTVVKLLELACHATKGRIRKLWMSTSAMTSHLSGGIALACPQLTQLTWSGNAYEIGGDVFLALASLPLCSVSAIPFEINVAQ